jgi:hypothetical protein
MSKIAGVTSTNEERIDSDDANASMVCAHKGASGTAGTGVSLTGSTQVVCQTTLGFIPRMAYIEGAGVLSFTTLDDSLHRLDLAAKSWVSGIFIKSYFLASHATTPTTATGVHFF